MNLCLVRKAPFRSPGSPRLVWSLVLAEREGLALVFLKKPEEDQPHALVVAAENVVERVFEPANGSVFPVEDDEVGEIGNTLQTLGAGLAKDSLFKLLRSDGPKP